MADIDEERAREYFQREFLPERPTGSDTELRIASALEYIAYQLGEMRKDLAAIRTNQTAANAPPRTVKR